MQKEVSLILATTFDGGIGYDDKIPWYNPNELQKFKDITSYVKDKSKINAIIMGRNTWESLPKRPLRNRLNIVITSNLQYNTQYKDVLVFNTLLSALMYCNNQNYIESLFIIGGAYVYNQILSDEIFNMYITKIYLSMMFHNKNYTVNKYIDINNIYSNFIFIKHEKYQKYSDDRQFASYICIPKYKNI
jgi:dihydrofolate reductase